MFGPYPEGATQWFRALPGCVVQCRVASDIRASSEPDPDSSHASEDSCYNRWPPKRRTYRFATAPMRRFHSSRKSRSKNERHQGICVTQNFYDYAILRTYTGRREQHREDPPLISPRHNHKAPWHTYGVRAGNLVRWMSTYNRSGG
jgi:hypothetical protein